MLLLSALFLTPAALDLGLATTASQIHLHIIRCAFWAILHVPKTWIPVPATAYLQGGGMAQTPMPRPPRYPAMQRSACIPRSPVWIGRAQNIETMPRDWCQDPGLALLSMTRAPLAMVGAVFSREKLTTSPARDVPTKGGWVGRTTAKWYRHSFQPLITIAPGFFCWLDEVGRQQPPFSPAFGWA